MKLFRVGLLPATIIAVSATASANVTIVPTWDSTITSDANSAQIQSTINQACNFYNAHFTDNITVNITFKKGGGLGSSSTGFVGVTYSNFRSALVTDSSTVDDALALSHLPTQTNDPVTNSQTTVFISRANAKALGFSVGAGNDSTITLNTDICNLVHGVNSNSGFYDLYAVACHEIDEALGTVAFVGNSAPSSADMFRYDGSGNRNWDTSTSHRAYFSIDGTTNIVEYNQLNRSGGDWGDWIHHSTPQVQDFSGSPGVTIDMGASETRLLDVVGYNYVVPEPASMAVLGFGVLGLVRRRRKK